MVMVCYSTRTQPKISKGKRCIEESPGETKRSFLLSSPLGAISWTWFSQQQRVRTCTKYCQAEKLTQALVSSVSIGSQLYSREHTCVSISSTLQTLHTITLFFCDCQDFQIILFWVPCVLRQKEHDPGPMHRTDVHHKSRCYHKRWHGHGYAKDLLSGRLLWATGAQQPSRARLGALCHVQPSPAVLSLLCAPSTVKTPGE